MKLAQKLAVISVGLPAFVTLASGQTFQYLDPVAAKYDLFLLEGNDNEMKFQERYFDGLLGVGSGASGKVENAVIFNGEARYHSNASGITGVFDPNGASTGSATFTGFDSDLNSANTAILNYRSYLQGLNPGNTSGATFESIGNQTSFIERTATSALTVLDFSTLTMDGSSDSFTLNGRPGWDDVFVIRIAGDTLFKSGAPVILSNLNRRNVLWVAGDGSDFDLHKNDGASFEGVIINLTEDKNTTIIGDVDFKGQVYAASMKLGSDLVFAGSSTFGAPIPEPSAILLLLGSIGSLILVRRRRK